MVIVKLKGGLGNQLFQYAFGRARALESGQELILDISHYMPGGEGEHSWPYELHKFHIAAQTELSREQKKVLKYNFEKTGIKNWWAKRFFPVENYNETSLAFEAALVPAQRGTHYIYDGYFQTERYFSSARDMLLEEISLKAPMSERSTTMLEQIRQSHSVALHVRRGDYISNPAANAVHGTCSLDYYCAAMSRLETELNDLCYFVFSDDIEWCKENLSSAGKFVYADYDQAVPPEEDMMLMRACNHQVIANSSFSWWAAWLNENSEKRVVAPKVWFRDTAMVADDLVPTSWIRL